MSRAADLLDKKSYNSFTKVKVCWIHRLNPEAATKDVLWKKVFLEIWQNSSEISGLSPATLLKKALAQVYVCEFC